MDQLTIRQATMEDKHAILDILDNVYGGTDYLWAYFDYFITAPNMTSYVAVIPDQIVGFVVADVVDEGSTVLTRAARTNPAFSGRGIYSSLISHAVRNTKAKSVAYTASSTNPAVNSMSFNHRQLLIRSSLYLVDDFHAMDIPLPSPTESDITTCSTDDLEYLMSSRPHKEYLFPNDRIIVNWVPYKLLPSNIPLFSHTGAVTKIVTSALSGIDVGKGLMSITTLFKCQNQKFACILDIYGTDSKCLKDHLLVHFRHVHAITNNETTLSIFTEPNIDAKYVMQTVKEIGIAESKINPDVFSELENQIMFEKDVLI